MYASENGHTATVELLLGAGADTDAKNEVRERKREYYTHTHTHKWLSRWFEGGSTMWSLFTSLELRLIHVRPGVEPARALFSFFFPL